MYGRMKAFAPIEPTQVSATHGSGSARRPTGQSRLASNRLDRLVERLFSFHKEYTEYFISRTRNVVELSEKYLGITVAF